MAELHPWAIDPERTGPHFLVCQWQRPTEAYPRTAHVSVSSIAWGMEAAPESRLTNIVAQLVAVHKIRPEDNPTWRTETWVWGNSPMAV